MTYFLIGLMCFVGLAGLLWYLAQDVVYTAEDHVDNQDN